MKIVIDISEYNREWISGAYDIPEEIRGIIARAILDGVILEDFGKLIDADRLIEDLKYDVKIDEDFLMDNSIDSINRELSQFDKDCKQNMIDTLMREPDILGREEG